MTVKEIAKLADVSVATVSRVLNNNPKVSAETRKRVLAVIQNTGFTLNQNARNLSTSKSNMVLVLIPTILNAFYSKILSGIEDEASKKGYQVLVGVTKLDTKREERFFNMIRAKQVDGIISFITKSQQSVVENIGSKYPYVECCEYSGADNITYVTIGNEEAAKQAVEHFINKGHKSIGLISGNYYECSEKARELGYKKALEENNIEFDPTKIVISDYTYETASKVTKELLTKHSNITAILCVSDSNAIGCINQLKKRNKKVGEEVEVIGFDNDSITKFYEPTISTVAQPRYDLGVQAMRLLHEKIEDINVISKKIILPHEIILRESSKR